MQVLAPTLVTHTVTLCSIWRPCTVRLPENSPFYILLLFSSYVRSTDTNFIVFHLHTGHSKSVLLLLERGARINTRNKYGNTLLHVAAMNGHTEMVLFLLDKGIKLTTKNNAGSTPLHYAGTSRRGKHSFAPFSLVFSHILTFLRT